VAVAVGKAHILALKSDGTVLAWGLDNSYGQCDVPLPNTGFVAVAGGDRHSLGLKSDGSIVAWGDNTDGQCDVPVPNSGFTAVAAGGKHSLGLQWDGSVVAWGDNLYHQCDVPTPNTDFVAISAGRSHNVAIRAAQPPVATMISSFGGSAVGTGVELRWDIVSDDDVRGFTIYRRIRGGDDVIAAGMLPADSRAYHDTGLSPGKTYVYRLGVVLGDGSEIPSVPATVRIGEMRLALEPNYPNPFNPSTTISFALPERVQVEVAIYDAGGRQVRVLAREHMDGGRRTISWDGRDDSGRLVSSGVYFCRLRAGHQLATRKLTVVR
jgi:hypothetical protein